MSKASVKRPSSPGPDRHARTPHPAPQPAHTKWAGVALIVVLTAAAYAPGINGGFILDDKLLISESPLIGAPDGLYRIWFSTDPIDYWPVTNSSFWIEWRLWERNTTGYHVTNLLLHIGTALLLWAALQRLAIPGAFLAALLFAVHPVNVESVAWITQRKNLLALVFSLLAALWYLGAEAGSGARRDGRWYWASVVAFVLAMLSKGSVAVLPALLLSALWWLRPLTRRDLVRAIPFVVVAVGLTLVNVAFQSRFAAGVRNVGGIERLLGAAAVVWFYLSKALLPLNLSFVYPKWEIRPDQIWWWISLLAAAATTGVLWWYRRDWGRPLWFAWLVFGIALAPVMGFTDVGFMEHSLVADHYQHLALIAVVGLVAAGWSACHRRTPAGQRWLPTTAAGAVVGLLAILTGRESALYADPIVLYEATLERNPSSAFAQNNLGLALLDIHRPEDAIEHFRLAIALKPNYPEAYYNVGRTLLDLGRPEDAIVEYEQAVRLKPMSAAYQHYLGTAFARARRPEDAIAHLEEALRLQPDFPEVDNNLGGVLFESGRSDEAIVHFERALRRKPDFAEAHGNLGRALLQARRLDTAIVHFREAARLTPASPDAHNDLGVALAEAGRLPEATTQFETAIRLRPDHANARANLDEVRAMAGNAPQPREP